MEFRADLGPVLVADLILFMASRAPPSQSRAKSVSFICLRTNKTRDDLGLAYNLV
jgi:hypothetical protein